MRHPEVDAYIQSLTRWKEEITALREIVLSCGLVEEWKWRQPCYSDQGVNLVMLGCYKDGSVISFLKGATLSDPEGILQKPGEHTRMGRVIRFTGISEILKMSGMIKDFVQESIRQGKMDEKMMVEVTPAMEIPKELQSRFDTDPDFQQAFFHLSPGRQRGYLIFFTTSKQTATRAGRIEKYKSRIMSGKGINDCTCGLSKKMPGCDGSHRMLETS